MEWRWNAVFLISLGAIWAAMTTAKPVSSLDPADESTRELAELEDAVRGEPGAYAARVRLRREDDARWASFDAPRNLR